MGGDALGASARAAPHTICGASPTKWARTPDAYAEPESWGEGGLWGVYRFKQGFGGQVVRYTGAWDLPLSRDRDYALYKLALRARKSQVTG